jgi:hypothetical protein
MVLGSLGTFIPAAGARSAADRPASVGRPGRAHRRAGGGRAGADRGAGRSPGLVRPSPHPYAGSRRGADRHPDHLLGGPPWPGGRNVDAGGRRAAAGGHHWGLIRAQPPAPPGRRPHRHAEALAHDLHRRRAAYAPAWTARRYGAFSDARLKQLAATATGDVARPSSPQPDPPRAVATAGEVEPYIPLAVGYRDMRHHSGRYEAPARAARQGWLTVRRAGVRFARGVLYGHFPLNIEERPMWAADREPTLPPKPWAPVHTRPSLRQPLPSAGHRRSTPEPRGGQGESLP